MEYQKTKSLNPKRVEWIDIAKGIGIIFVVLGHSGIPKLATWWVWSFHMPLFFAISGLLFSVNRYPSLSDLIKKRNAGLMRAYFFFVLISFVLMYYLGEAFNVKDILLKGSGLALWFIPVLYVTEILYYNLKKYFNNKILCSFLIASALFGYYLSKFNIHFPYNLGAVFTAIVFYGAGNIASETIKKYLDSLDDKKGIVFTLLFIAINVIFCLLNHGRLDLFKNVIGNFFYAYFSAFAGIMVIFSISYAIAKTNLSLLTSLNKVFIFLGMNTLVILGTHQMVKLTLAKLFNDFHVVGVMSLIGRHLLLWILLVFVIYIVNGFLPFVIGKKYKSQKEQIKETGTPLST